MMDHNANQVAFRENTWRILIAAIVILCLLAVVILVIAAVMISMILSERKHDDTKAAKPYAKLTQGKCTLYLFQRCLIELN